MFFTLPVSRDCVKIHLPRINKKAQTQMVCALSSEIEIQKSLCFRNLDRVDLDTRRTGASWIAFGDRVDHIYTGDHFAKHGMLAVKVRRGTIGDEELAAIGVGAGIRHRQDARAAVFQGRVEFIGKFVTGSAAP